MKKLHFKNNEALMSFIVKSKINDLVLHGQVSFTISKLVILNTNYLMLTIRGSVSVIQSLYNQFK